MKKISFLLFISLSLILIPHHTIMVQITPDTSPTKEIKTSRIKIDQTTPLQVGDKAIDFKLYDFYERNDSIYNLNYFKDKVILFDAMASWCGPCQESMPEMVRLYDIFKNTGQVTFLSIAIDRDEPDEDLMWFHDTFGVQWHFTRDYVGAINESSWWEVYGSGYIPTYYIVDKSGIIQRGEVGWYGIESYFDQIKSMINVTDTETPNIVDVTTDKSAFSIEDQSMTVYVNASDNFGVKTVIGTAEYNGFKITQEMPYDYANKKFKAKFNFNPEVIYDAESDVTFSFEIIDWYDNKFTASDVKKVGVKKVEDETPPELIFTKIEEFNSLDHYLNISLSIKDVYVFDPIITETNPSTGESRTFEPLSRKLSTILKFNYKIDLQDNVDVTCNTYSVTIKDLAGNTINETLDFKFKDAPIDGCNAESNKAPLDFWIGFSIMVILIRLVRYDKHNYN